MALYAFDGTWNEDEGNPGKDTNVVKLCRAYRGANHHYIEGVGTRYGVLGRVVGGAFGAGGRTRIEEMYDKLCEFWEAGDHDIDIVGFSRGAALAVHFANVIDVVGVRRGGDARGTVLEARPTVRFLGVWDIVGSFGIPRDIVFDFQEINLGYDLGAPGNVERCCHAMALDERRASFRVTRLDKHNENDAVDELWFRGVHTDVGGGGGTPELSNIALAWMLERAIERGVPLDPGAIPADEAMDNQAPLSHNFDPIVDPRRRVWPNDRFHDTAMTRGIPVGGTARARVHAAERYSWTGIRLEKGARYRFTVPAGDTWKDATIECGPNGWTTDALPWVRSRIVKRFEDERRVPNANWFELIGSIEDDGDAFFRIGVGIDPFVAPDSGDLYAFANDLDSTYGNNQGEIELVVTRLP